MIYLDRKEKKPLYQQLYEAIIAEIHDGTLKTDDALKPIRFLADELNISLNTVQKAYQQLLAEGYIRSVPGSPQFCSSIQPLIAWKSFVLRLPSIFSFEI